MFSKSDVYMEDLESIVANKAVDWDKLKDGTVLVTGATGLIGSNIVNALLYANKVKNSNITVVALVRNIDKAVYVFGTPESFDNKLVFVQGTVENLPHIDCEIDYIIHGASPTASSFFINNPVETIKTAVWGTDNMLQLAKEKQVKGFVYLSSMEVYGLPEKSTKVTENMIGALSPLVTRNSYPLSKQQCESLCVAYSSEYGVPAKIARLTQTFGPGVKYDDGRVFAEFARCVIEKRNIVLKTKGETERDYLYTADAVTAILTILLRGENGQAYSVANEDTYCSIAQMADTVAMLGKICVEFQLQDVEKLGYAPTLYMDLDTSKLKSLGWKPETNLKDMYTRMIADICRGE